MIVKNPFQLNTQPITITIQSETTTIAQGINQSLNEASRNTAPKLQERVTKPVEKNAVPEKTQPKINHLKENSPSIKEAFKENLKKTETVDPKSELKKEKVSEVPVQNKQSDETSKKLDEYLEQESKNDLINKQMKDVSDNVDQILNEDSTASTGNKGNGNGVDNFIKGDPLSDAEWSAQPRKTVFFPDIQSKIPPQYKKKGMGYSITAKIAFDKNGLAIRADITKSSGDPNIDSVFFSELKKIRIESVSEDRIDEIVKTFTISLK